LPSPRALFQPTHQHRLRAGYSLLLLGGLSLCTALGSSPAAAQAPGSVTPLAWINAAVGNELNIINNNGSFPVRYRVHKIDAKGDVTREVIETEQGSVARQVQRDGHPLSPEDDTAERARLQAILDDPSDFLKHHKRDLAARSYALDLVKLMPQAMVYTYTPGQPQPPGAPGPQIVIDFHPDPNFKPPTLISELLTGLEGRLWIDQRTHCLTRAEGRVIRPVNFGWGILAHIYPGGTIEFEQAEAAPNRWLYSHVDENITVREMMLKTAVEQAKMTAYNIQMLPAPIDYRTAIHELLNMPTH
jgi:hypothetical protein